MALFHKATLSPTKLEMLTAWVPTQTWSPDGAEVSLIGAFRFNDPEGQVGIETFLVEVDGVLLQVPVTYRPEPLEGAEGALITEMHHSALGNRWVYDGITDHRYLTMLAAVAMTGQGEALGMVEDEGRWLVAPANVRLEGGGWTGERAIVDGFSSTGITEQTATFSNERFGLGFHRRPKDAERPPLGLAATWAEQTGRCLLAEVGEL